MFLFKNNMATKKITFHIENDEEEERVTISIKGIGKVILAVTFPEYEFLEDIGEDGLEELNVEEGDLIGKIEHLEINDEYKGQGYAKILMNKAIELAKEKGLMPLYLNASPMGSKRYGLDVDDLTGFYESLGFEVFLRQGGNNLMILKDTYKTGGETKNKIMAKQIKIQFEDNYANGGVTYIEWSKDNVWQEQFNDWKEDGNVSKNADGTYSTQDAQYTNSLKGISGLKKYFYNEFIKGQYAEGGTTDNNHLIAKAIEFIIGTAIDKDSIEIEPTEISYKRKNINVYSSLNKKLIDDTILMHRKSLEGRYAEGGSVTYDIVWQDKYGEEYSEGFDTIEEVNELINNIKKNGGRIIEKAKYIDNNFKGYFAEGGSVGKGYSVFNYTDNIYATDEVFKTKKLANDFIKQFRNRFSKQGYYRDNQMNKIDIEDIDLLAIPSDFNPFGKYEDGGEMQEEKFRYKDFYQSQGGIKFKTEEEAERFIKTTKPFVRKQLREGNFVLVFNGKEYFIAEKIKINDEYADGGEVMVNGLTKQDFIDAFQNRVEKLIQELKKEGTYDENTFDFLYEIVEKDRDGGFTDIEETGFWLSSQDVDGYDKLAYYLSFDKNVGYRNYTDKVLSHFYFGKPMKIEFVLNTGGDTELGLEDELQKIKLLLNKIDFNKVVGSIDYDKTKNNTDLDFYKDVELVMSLNGDWNETTEELDTTIDFNDETAELNYHPLDTMGGLDLTQLEENINEAFRELNTYSAVVSIEGYEEYAEDVEGLENAKALMQDIKGNTRFQVLKGSSVGIGKRVDDSRVIEEFARGGETKTPKKYIVKGNVYDGGEIWKETFDNIDEAIDLAREIQNGWTDDGTYYLITIYDEKGKKVASISDDKYFNELTEHKLFKKVDLGADTKKERQLENEKLKGYKFNLQVRIADGGATGIFDKTFDSIFEVMDKMNTYYEEDYYARINDESLDYWEDKYSEIDLSRNYIKGKYGWSFIKENGYWIAKGDYDENHIVRLEKGKPVADSSVTKGALKQIMELEAQKKYSEKPKHNKSLSDMKKIWDKLSNNYNEREDIAFLIGYYGGLLSDIVPYKWNELDKSIQIQIMNAYFGKTEEEKQKIINQTRKHHEALVKKHKTLKNLYGKKFADGGVTDNDLRKLLPKEKMLKLLKETKFKDFDSSKIEYIEYDTNTYNPFITNFRLTINCFPCIIIIDQISDNAYEVQIAKDDGNIAGIYKDSWEYIFEIPKLNYEEFEKGLKKVINDKIIVLYNYVDFVKTFYFVGTIEEAEKFAKKNGFKNEYYKNEHYDSVKEKYTYTLDKKRGIRSFYREINNPSLSRFEPTKTYLYIGTDTKREIERSRLDNWNRSVSGGIKKLEKYDDGGDVDFVEAQINDIVNWDNDEIASYLQIPVNEVANNRLEYIEEAQNSMLVNQVDGNYAKGGQAGKLKDYIIYSWKSKNDVVNDNYEITNEEEMTEKEVIELYQERMRRGYDFAVQIYEKGKNRKQIYSSKSYDDVIDALYSDSEEEGNDSYDLKENILSKYGLHLEGNRVRTNFKSTAYEIANEYDGDVEQDADYYIVSFRNIYAKGGEAGFDNEGTSMVLYHEKKGNWLVPKGQVYLYLYDVEGSGSKLGKEFDWVFYPLTAPIMAFQSDYIPPLKKIWTKKFQKDHKGSEHLLGVIKSYLIEEDGKKELFIDMMSVNPTKKKKGIMSYMIKELRESFNLSQDQVTFSKLTPEGEKFVAKKTYADGGEITIRHEIKNGKKNYFLYDIKTGKKSGSYKSQTEANDKLKNLLQMKYALKLSSRKYADGGEAGYELENYIISGKNFKNKYATDFNGQVAKVIYTKNLDLGSNLGKGSYWNVTQDSLDIYSGNRDEELDSKYGQYFKNTIYKKIDDNLKIFVKDEIADELWDNEKLYNKIKNISDGIYDPSYDDYGLLLFENQYADGGVAESMNFFVVNNENDKYYNWVGYNVDETITDKQGNEFEKLYFENKKLPKKYNVNDLIYLEQRDTFTQKDKYGGSDTEYVILVNYQYSSKPFDFYYYLYNVTKKFVATEGNLDWVKSNLPRGWKFYDSYADGGETSGLITDEQVKDLSFKIKIKNVPLKKGVLLHEIVTLEEFDLPDEENINFYPFHLIYGDSSLAIFDAFGVDEVAGLKRKDCEEFINNLKAQGKTEKDGSFIAGLTNYVGDKLFMFFNVARLSYEGFANRVLPHEALHLSRSLISLYKNDWVRENLNTPKWWEDKRAVFVDMGDSNEEFFAETLERTTAIAMDGWYRVTGQKCVVEKNKTYADGGKIGKLKVLQKIVYESIKNKPSKSITTYNLPSDTRKILEELYYMDLLDRNYINGTQEAEYTLKYANGGDVPHEDKMFQLPLEMVVYVPSTQDVDKVISVDKMVTRVDEVKEYLASKFGGYTSADKLGGFVDSTGNLVNEDVVQVTAFATKEAYAQYKEELIHQLALWGKKWGQEAIGFEFEGDLMYVPQEL